MPGNKNSTSSRNDHQPDTTPLDNGNLLEQEASVPQPDAEHRIEPTMQIPDIPIVGIGASAGGLAAFEAFFSGMPADKKPGMAFVLVQHLAPDHKSMLTELISRSTKMRVFEVEDGMTTMVDCVYIIPPNRGLILDKGVLRLLDPPEQRGIRTPIDEFFCSMARELGEKAVCIVLSGTGSDGAKGIEEIKSHGGLVMAQRPEHLTFDGMPRSAIATGLTDFVLDPEEMPTALIQHMGLPRKPHTPPSMTDQTILAFCELLHSQTGHDFSQYKKNTLIRRIERRMAQQNINRATDYLHHLRNTPAELQNLFRDLLIGVTSFFRDPEVFTTIKGKIIPKLFAGKPSGGTVRIWICGCSSGEEAYSFAILLREYEQSVSKNFNIQVFATDIDQEAIQHARSGFYPPEIADNISPERLTRFFTREPDGRYRVKKELRDLLIFSEQDVIKDPPFSRIDLISCRNLLIYLNAPLQKKLITLFHYALTPKGFLVLGNSETAGEPGPLFSTVDRKHKLYRRQENPGGSPHAHLCRFISTQTNSVLPIQAPLATPPKNNGLNLRKLTEQTILAHYGIAAVLINSYGDILHIYGRTGRYLEPAAGDAEMNILAMAREGLRPGLANALYRAVSRMKPVHISELQVKTNGGFSAVNLTLRPALFPGAPPKSALFLAILEEPSQSPAPSEAGILSAGGEAEPPLPQTKNGQIEALEKELRAKDEYLQSTIEEMNTSLEELKSTNEELQSVNEELQSSNEELETSKEELQSINEEMTTVNAELQGKVSELANANNDMNNLLSGTGIATLFVDHTLRIVRFTPSTTKLINLIQADINRPVGHIVTNLTGYDRLVEDLQDVLRDLSPREVEVQTKTGTWFLMRMSPYRTLENVIQGAVITFTDITELRQARTSAEESRLLVRIIMENVRESVLLLDESLKIVAANPAFHRAFPTRTNNVIGYNLLDSYNGQWDIPAFRSMLEDVLSKREEFEDFQITLAPQGQKKRSLHINARHIPSRFGQDVWILLVIEDAETRSEP